MDNAKPCTGLRLPALLDTAQDMNTRVTASNLTPLRQVDRTKINVGEIAWWRPRDRNKRQTTLRDGVQPGTPHKPSRCKGVSKGVSFLNYFIDTSCNACVCRVITEHPCTANWTQGKRFSTVSSTSRPPAAWTAASLWCLSMPKMLPLRLTPAVWFLRYSTMISDAKC